METNATRQRVERERGKKKLGNFQPTKIISESKQNARGRREKLNSNSVASLSLSSRTLPPSPAGAANRTGLDRRAPVPEQGPPFRSLFPAR